MRIGIVAPHSLSVPMDGGSIRARAIASGLANADYEVFFFGREEHLCIKKGEVPRQLLNIPRHGSKLVPALSALIRHSHYVKEKHMPERWIVATCEALESLRPKIVLLNFVWSYEVVRRLSYKPRIFLDTHNNEVEWFDNLINHGQNLLGRIVCRSSIRYSLRIIEKMDKGTELVHVSDRDCQFYKSKRPDLVHRLLPNGCFVKPRAAIPDYRSGIKHLFFLGSLSTGMNQDALKVFADTFWPSLKDEATFTVIGSNPPPFVGALCEKLGWALSINPSAEALDEQLKGMHFAVLPFSYGAGSKLKLLDACGRGIPVLSTSCGVTGFTDLPAGVFVSEHPDEWLQAIRKISAPESTRDSLLWFANYYSWDTLVKKFISETGL